MSISPSSSSASSTLLSVELLRSQLRAIRQKQTIIMERFGKFDLLNKPITHLHKPLLVDKDGNLILPASCGTDGSEERERKRSEGEDANANGSNDGAHTNAVTNSGAVDDSMGSGDLDSILRIAADEMQKTDSEGAEGNRAENTGDSGARASTGKTDNTISESIGDGDGHSNGSVSGSGGSSNTELAPFLNFYENPYFDGARPPALSLLQMQMQENRERRKKKQTKSMLGAMYRKMLKDKERDKERARRREQEQVRRQGMVLVEGHSKDKYPGLEGRQIYIYVFNIHRCKYQIRRM